MSDNITNDMMNEYIQICIGCCKLNRENSKTVPLICPKTNMPCFAFEPKYLIPEVSEEMISFLEKFNINNKENPRVPIDSKYISKHFVNTRCEAFEMLAKKGNKTIYTMEAY